MKQINQNLKIHSQELIEEHRSSLDPDNPKDLMDGYLLDIEASKDDPDVVRTGKTFYFGACEGSCP